jgi:hydrogenase maturation factor
MEKDKKTLPSGKLKFDLLDSILKRFKNRDPKVIVGPTVGEDAAVIDMGDEYLIATADPITFTADNIGYYSINVNANDIAVHGARPRWFLATILLPLGNSDEKTIRDIFGQIEAAMEPLDVTLVGGHTEVTDSVIRPVVSGLMLGEVKKESLITTGGARPGDLIFLTKGIPVEGTAIIAAEMEGDLKKRGVGREVIDEAKGFLYNPGISVVKDALLAKDTAPVSSMHDPTEGGLAAGLNEVAIAAGVTMTVREADIPRYPIGERLCEIYGIDPIGTISSGTLLFTADPKYKERLEEAFSKGKIPLAEIGVVEEASSDRVYIITNDGDRRPLPYKERDEILKIFG